MRPVIFSLLMACGAFAQQRPGMTGGIPITTPPPNRVAATPGHVLAPPPVRAVPHPRHGRTVIVPYPVFYGGYYGYDAPPAANAPAGPVYDPAYTDSSQSPVVIINQNFRPDAVNPVIHDYTHTQLPEAAVRPDPVDDRVVVIIDAEPTIYLIAMRDHTIFPALAYWVEGDTLNYITTEGSHNRASLDLVDRDFSKQLNDERHVQFKLPPAK